MHFPSWADGPRLTKKQRATGRLRYILMTLSTELTGRNSMRAFGQLVGLDHSTLSKYITQGYFTEKAASQVQVRIGDKGQFKVTAEMLMKPLDIQKSSFTI